MSQLARQLQFCAEARHANAALGRDIGGWIEEQREIAGLLIAGNYIDRLEELLNS